MSTILQKDGIRQRMQCRGSMAANIESTFVTVEQMLDAIESDEPLTNVSGIGPKTEWHIMEWYENRFEREKAMQSSSVERTSNTSLNIKFHKSWDEALGVDSDE